MRTRSIPYIDHLHSTPSLELKSSILFFGLRIKNGVVMFAFRKGAGGSDEFDPQLLNNAGKNVIIAHEGEKMTSSIIDPRFRITIPKEIRERVGLQVGDKIGFLNDGDLITMVKVPEDPLLAMAGSLHFDGDVRQYLRELKEEDLAEED